MAPTVNRKPNEWVVSLDQFLFIGRVHFPAPFPSQSPSLLTDDEARDKCFLLPLNNIDVDDDGDFTC